MARRRTNPPIDIARQGSNDLASQLLKLAALACLVVLLFASLTPSAYVVRTGADSRLEHFAAYAGSAMIVAAAYRARFGASTIALLLIAYAGLLETGQLFVPSRYASLLDWGASSAGVIVGSAFATIFFARSGKEPATSQARPPDRLSSESHRL